MNKEYLAKIIQNRICKIKKTSFSKSSPFFIKRDDTFYYDKEDIYDISLNTINKIKNITSYKEIVDAFMGDVDLYTTDKSYFLAFMYAIISDIELDKEYCLKERYLTYKAMNREYGLPYQKVKPKLKLHGYLDNGYPNEYAIINGFAKVYFIENEDKEQNIVKIMWKKELMDEILGKYSDIEKLGFIQNPHHVDRNLTEIAVRLIEIIDKKTLEDEYDDQISEVCHHTWLMYSPNEIINLLHRDFKPLFEKAFKNRPRITKQLNESYEKNIEYIMRKIE